MAAERTGAGDPARTLRLLWRAALPGLPRRGPRQTLSVDEVVDAAVTIADADGLDAVTMRGIADRLGVSAMSVYTYVPGKAELLDLMVDLIYLQMPRAAWRTRSWRKRLTRVAADNRALYDAHPWAATVASLSRPPLGPGLMAKYEHELSAFDGTGLDDVRVDAALTLVLQFVQAWARTASDIAAATDGDRSDDAWWAANAPLLAQVVDESAYPRAVRIGAAAGAAQGGAYDADRAYEFGLGRILDGIGALLDTGDLSERQNS